MYGRIDQLRHKYFKDQELSIKLNLQNSFFDVLGNKDSEKENTMKMVSEYLNSKEIQLKYDRSSVKGKFDDNFYHYLKQFDNHLEEKKRYKVETFYNNEDQLPRIMTTYVKDKKYMSQTGTIKKQYVN